MDACVHWHLLYTAVVAGSWSRLQSCNSCRVSPVMHARGACSCNGPLIVSSAYCHDGSCFAHKVLHAWWHCVGRFAIPVLFWLFIGLCWMLQWLLEAGALPKLLALLQDADSACRRKALLAISCLVRQSSPAMTAFRLSAGVPRLITAGSDSDPRLAR